MNRLQRVKDEIEFNNAMALLGMRIARIKKQAERNAIYDAQLRVRATNACYLLWGVFFGIILGRML
jgi:hypothetical protein